MAPTKARVLIVDDSFDIASLYHRLINDQPDLESAGMHASADGLVRLAAEADVQVVLLDLSMPGADPLACIPQLAEHVPGARVVVLSGHDDADTVAAVLNAGAWGFVSKLEEPRAVIHVIRRAIAGQASFPSVGL